MNCVLTKENQRQIEALIRSGRFNNRSEVLRAGETQHRWNCTEVCRRTHGEWRIIQTHWSFTQAGK